MIINKTVEHKTYTPDNNEDAYLPLTLTFAGLMIIVLIALLCRLCSEEDSLRTSSQTIETDDLPTYDDVQNSNIFSISETITNIPPSYEKAVENDTPPAYSFVNEAFAPPEYVP